MLAFENQNIEFKQEYVPDIRKEVMGFANAEGGTVYVGVRKDGVVLGISDPDGVMLQIVNSLKDSLAPDIMPFVRVNTVEIEEKQVIEIDVTKGEKKMIKDMHNNPPVGKYLIQPGSFPDYREIIKSSKEELYQRILQGK